MKYTRFRQNFGVQSPWGQLQMTPLRHWTEEIGSQIPPHGVFSCSLCIYKWMWFAYYIFILFACIRSTPMSRMPKKILFLWGGHLYGSIASFDPTFFWGCSTHSRSVQDAVLAIDSTMMEAFQFQESLGSLVRLWGKASIFRGFTRNAHTWHAEIKINGLLLPFLETFQFCGLEAF